MVKLFSLKSPDEWATTKQACRDTYVVTCFLPSTIRILALLYVLSTVLRISSSNLLYIYIYIYKQTNKQKGYASYLNSEYMRNIHLLEISCKN